MYFRRCITKYSQVQDREEKTKEEDRNIESRHFENTNHFKEMAMAEVMVETNGDEFGVMVRPQDDQLPESEGEEDEQGKIPRCSKCGYILFIEDTFEDQGNPKTVCWSAHCLFK